MATPEAAEDSTAVPKAVGFSSRAGLELVDPGLKARISSLLGSRAGIVTVVNGEPSGTVGSEVFVFDGSASVLACNRPGCEGYNSSFAGLSTGELLSALGDSRSHMKAVLMVPASADEAPCLHVIGDPSSGAIPGDEPPCSSPVGLPFNELKAICLSAYGLEPASLSLLTREFFSTSFFGEAIRVVFDGVFEELVDVTEGRFQQNSFLAALALLEVLGRRGKGQGKMLLADPSGRGRGSQLLTIPDDFNLLDWLDLPEANADELAIPLLGQAHAVVLNEWFQVERDTRACPIAKGAAVLTLFNKRVFPKVLILMRSSGKGRASFFKVTDTEAIDEGLSLVKQRSHLSSSRSPRCREAPEIDRDVYISDEWNPLGYASHFLNSLRRPREDNKW